MQPGQTELPIEMEISEDNADSENKSKSLEAATVSVASKIHGDVMRNRGSARAKEH